MASQELAHRGIAFNTTEQLIFFAREHDVLSGNGTNENMLAV
jgi:hypothetical protein